MDEEKSIHYHEKDKVFKFTSSPRIVLAQFMRRHSKFITSIIKLILHGLLITYAVFATMHWFKGNEPFKIRSRFGAFTILIGIIYWSFFYYKLLKPFLSKITKRRFYRSLTNVGRYDRVKRLGIYAVWTILITGFILFLIIDTADNRYRLVPLLGIITFIVGGCLISDNPSKIEWSIVGKGFTLLVVFALIMIRWKEGNTLFYTLGREAEKFLSFSEEGSTLIYGNDLIHEHAVFAFKVLSVLLYVGMVAEILNHYNLLARIFEICGSFLQFIIGTSIIESAFCCSSAVLGCSESILLIKPFIKDLTMSELQTVYVGGLSTVSGSLFAAYISLGANPGSLVIASVMAAPTALIYSKIMYPETEESKRKNGKLSDLNEENKDDVTLIEVACRGALSAIPIIQAIIASIIAFVSFAAFLNSATVWFGILVGVDNLTLDMILSKCFIPVALLIGIDVSECAIVAKLIATKALINEFVAYRELGKYKRLNMLSPRTQIIATYALCSFANPGSVVSMLAGISAVCPEQRSNAGKLVVKAYIGGTVTCLITACLAAILTSDLALEEVNSFSSIYNSTTF